MTAICPNRTSPVGGEVHLVGGGEDLVTGVLEDGECESMSVAEAGGGLCWPQMIWGWSVPILRPTINWSLYTTTTPGEGMQSWRDFPGWENPDDIWNMFPQLSKLN